MTPRMPSPRSLLFVLVVAGLGVVGTAHAQPAMRKAEVSILDNDAFATLAKIEDELRAARALLYKPDRVLDDYTRAREHLDRALAIDPGRARTWFEVAELYRYGIDASQAWPFYEEFLLLAEDRDSDWGAAHKLLAERGLDELRGYDYVVPEQLLDDTETHLLAAYEVYRGQHNSGVMAELEDYLRVLATVRGDFETALRFARAAIDHGHPYRFEIALKSSMLLSLLDRDEEALDYLEQLPAELRGPALNTLEARYELNERVAETHRRLGNHETALQYLAVLEGDIEFAQQQQLEFQVGGSSAQQQAYFDGFRARLHGTRASVFSDMGEYELAVDEFRMAWGLAPGDPGSMNNLAWALALVSEIGDPRLEEAEQLARQAVALAPRAAYLDTLAEVLIRRQAYDEALDVIDQAIEQAPDSQYLHSQRRRVERIQAGDPVLGGTIELVRPWTPPRGASL